jgi:ligand-binding sensor domain-containing protein
MLTQKNRERSFFLAILCSLFSYSSCLAQEYSYTHYDIADGLAGSTAYCITQDADGFIWVGTETGVSRFDGTHFKNFTTADGLPDIEVIQIFGDSRGRVWMAPFRKSLCYYYKGRIHNPDNDTLLHKFSLRGNIEGFAEDADGNVLIAERTGLHVVQTDGRIRNYDSINHQPIRECGAISRSVAGHFLVQEGQGIWSLSGDKFSLLRSIDFPSVIPNYIGMGQRWAAWRESRTRSAIGSLTTGMMYHRTLDTFHYQHNNYSVTDDSSVCFCEFTGATLMNLHDGSSRRFLPGLQVSRAFRDKDGSLWFTTLDHGLYRLNSEEIRTVVLFNRSQQPEPVWSMVKSKDILWAGTDRNQVFRLSSANGELAAKSSTPAEAKNKVVFLDTIGNGLVVVTGGGVGRTTSKLQTVRTIRFNAKWACRISRDELIIGSYLGCVIYDIRKFAVTDTLWRERVTALCYDSGTIYLGTFSGLYRISPDKSVTFLGQKIPFLSKRISFVTVAPDHTLWAASADDPGIIGVRNESVVAKFSRQEGLTSDICRTLLIRDHILWVGTDKGLNAIRLDQPGYPVTQYTSKDGLGSDMINTLYADSKMIYVGSPAGVSFFDERRVRIGEPCRLLLLNAVNSGKDRIADTAGLFLSYRKANIRLGYVGISYRSAGDIIYRYRIPGLDSNWQETGQTFLDYPSLPPGKYEFQLQAINRLGVRSELLVLPFVVDTPFWKQPWFFAILLVVFLSATWLFAAWRIRRARRQQEQKAMQSRRMAELEHIALQSQMNPHFIFNCLNSIQQFVFDKDMMATNEYISGFARLIRATLNYSSRPFISVAEEVEYLGDYLSLEKMRFKNKMDYRIVVEPGLDVRRSLLPPMLLQPYVENSVRHGLRNKTTGQGFIDIDFRNIGEKMIVTILDNGIGRKKALEYKTGEHIEYQSKGMSLTSARIQMIRVLYKSEIEVRVADLQDGDGQPEGTRIEISFPVFRDVAGQG